MIYKILAWVYLLCTHLQLCLGDSSKVTSRSLIAWSSLGQKLSKLPFSCHRVPLPSETSTSPKFLQYSDKALMILLQLKSFPGASASKSTTDHQRTIWPRRVIIQIENSLYIFSASINQLLRSHNSLSYITDFNLLLWVLFPLWSVKILSGAVPVHFTRFVVLKLSKSPRVPCSKAQRAEHPLWRYHSVASSYLEASTERAWGMISLQNWNRIATHRDFPRQMRKGTAKNTLYGLYDHQKNCHFEKVGISWTKVGHSANTNGVVVNIFQKMIRVQLHYASFGNLQLSATWRWDFCCMGLTCSILFLLNPAPLDSVLYSMLQVKQFSMSRYFAAPVLSFFRSTNWHSCAAPESVRHKDFYHYTGSREGIPYFTWSGIWFHMISHDFTNIHRKPWFLLISCFNEARIPTAPKPNPGILPCKYSTTWANHLELVSAQWAYTQRNSMLLIRSGLFSLAGTNAYAPNTGNLIAL